MLGFHRANPPHKGKPGQLDERQNVDYLEIWEAIMSKAYFKIKYESPYGYMIYKDGKRWSYLYFGDEFAAIDEIKECGYVKEADELSRSVE